MARLLTYDGQVIDPTAYIYIYICAVESKLGPKIAFFESKLGPIFFFLFFLLSSGRMRFSQKKQEQIN